jgi:hypothetical protein
MRKMTDNILYVDFKNKKRIEHSIAEAPSAVPTLFNEKRRRFLELLELGIVRTVSSGNDPNLLLPQHIYAQEVHLNWSSKFLISDLVINDNGISGTLSFNQTPSHVTVPWSSIISMWSLSHPKDYRFDWDINE